MADERNVIEIILKARDETSAAFSAVAAKMGLAQAAARDTARENKNLEESYRTLTSESERSRVSFEKLGSSIGANKKDISDHIKLDKELAQSHVDVEKAANRLADTYDRSKHSISEQAVAERNLEEATKKLSDAFEEQIKANANLNDEEKKLERDRASRHVSEVRRIAEETALDKKQKEAVISGAKDRQKALQTLDQIEADIANRTQKRREAELQDVLRKERQNKQALQEREKALETLDRTEEDIAKRAQKRRDADLQDVLRKERQNNKALQDHANALKALDKIDEDIAKRTQQRRQEDLRDAQRLSRAREDDVRKRKAETAQDVEDVRRATDSLKQYETQIKRAAEAKRDLAKQKLTEKETIRIDVDRKAALAQAASLKSGLTALLKHIEANVDLDSTAFEEHAGEVEVVKALLGKDIHINVDADIGAAVDKLIALEVAERSVARSGNDMGGTLRGAFGGVTELLSGMSGNVAAFDNALRGAAAFVVVGFLQPLITLGGAAAGALIAVGSAAIYAGGALGGALVAGLSQALPVLGVIALAVGRISAVFGAAKQAQLAQQQATIGGTKSAQQATNAHNTQAKAANTLANSTDSLKSAEEGLANAHRSVGTAETALGKARQQAKRDLQDMVLAEKQAQLQAEASALAQKDAAGALTLAIRSGGDVQRAQLDVQSAALDRQQTGQAAGRARADLGTARAQGVEGAPGVVSAKKQVDDAVRSVGDAERAVTRAKRTMDSAGISADQAAANAGLAGQAISAAAGKADFLAAKLSPTEKKLLETVKRFKDAFLGFSQFVTEPIISAVDGMMKKVITLMDNKDIRSALRGLSGEVASQAKRFFDAFTNKGAINTFLGFIHEAQRNLKPLTDILIDLGRIFLNIARAAAPSFKVLLDFIATATENFRKFTATPKGRNELRDFFKQGTDALIAFLKLGGAFAKLFLAIAGSGGGAKAGTDLINTLAKAVNGLADAVNKKGSPAWKFFHDLFRITKEVIKDLLPIFSAIGDEFGKTFSGQGLDSVKAFADVFAKVIVPAIGTFIREVGRIVVKIGNFIDQHPKIANLAKDFLGIGLAIGLAGKAAGLVVGPVLGLYGKVKSLVGIFRDLAGAAKGAFSTAGGAAEAAAGAAKKGGGPVGMIEGMGASAAAEGGVLTAGAAGAEGAAGAATLALPPVAIVVGIVAALTGLLAVTGNLKPVLKAFGDAFDHIVDVAGPPLQDLIKQVKDLFKAFEGGKGAFAIVKPIMDFFTKQVLIRAIKALGDVIGTVFGGIFKVLGGFVELITGILTLNPHKIVDAFKKMGSGILDVFSGLVRFVGIFVSMIPALIIKVLTALIPKLFALGKRLGRAIGNALSDLGRIIGHAFSSAFNKALDFVEGLFGKFKHRASRIVDGIVDAITGVGGKVLHVITGGFNTVLGFFEGLPGKFKTKAGDIVTAVVSVFKGLGGKIIDGIVSAGAHGIDFAKQFGKTVAQLIDKAIPNSIEMPGPIPNIDLPNNPLKDLGLYAQGGPVPGSGRGDRVRALLEPGEHVLTRAEVQAAGGHGIIFALRRALGGGTQGGPFGFAEGGAVRGQKGQQAAASGQIDIDFGTSTKEIDKFTDKVVSLWNNMWRSLRRSTNSNTNQIENAFKSFGNSVRNLVNTLGSRVENRFDKMRKSVSQDSNQLLNSVKTSFSNLDTAVYQGLTYMGNAANTALKSFGAKPVSLSVDKPKGLAGGGWVGRQGERGRDGVPALLGRGEAVLNWGHQKIVDPALRAAYGFGLPELFGRTDGFHAGDSSTSPGFAKGGSTHIDRLVTAANKVNAANFPYVWGGGHEQPSHFEPFDCSGSVSYVTQQAGYKVPTTVSGGMGSWGFPSGPGEVTIFYNPGHTFMKIGQRFFGTSGFARPNGGAGWFTQSPSPSYLSQFATTHLTDLGGDAPFMTASGFEGIQKMVVHGTGILKVLAQAVLDKVTGKANEYISKKESALSAGSGQLGDFIDFGGSGPVASQIWNILHAAGFNKVGASGVIGNAYGESNLNPSAMEPGTHNGGLWGFTASPVSLSDVQAFAASVGKPWTSAAVQTQFLLNHITAGLRDQLNAAGSPQEAASIFMREFERPNAALAHEDVRQNAALTAFRAGFAKGGFAGEFDVGGELPGGEGQPIPIIAHGREWILNRGQQQKVAKWLGTSRDRLKGALGFTGGPTSFAGGKGDTGGNGKNGDDDVLDLSLGSLKLPKKGSLAKAVKAAEAILKAFADVGGLIESAFNPGDVRRMQIVTTRITAAVAKLNKATLKIGPKGKGFTDSLDKFLDGIDQLTKQDSGVLDLLAAAIDTHVTQMATRLSLAQTGLKEVHRKLTTRLVSKKALTDYQSAVQAVANTETTLGELGRERRGVANDLKSVNQELGKIREGGVTQKERKTYERLLGDRSGFLNRIDDIDGKLAQARQDLFTETQTKFQAQTDKAMAGAQKAGERSVPQAIFNRLRSVIGGTASKLMGHLVSPDTLNRIGTALGRTGMVDAATNEQLAILKNQQKVIEQRLRVANRKAKSDPRWQQVADDLATQLQDVTASIVETQAQALQARVDEINNKAQRRQTGLDLFGRLADVQERLGDPTTAARTRLAVLQGTGQNLVAQRAALQGALQTATIQGNTGQMQALGDQIADLSVSIVENTAAMSDQTVAIRQTTIDAIQNRAQFQGGVFGGLGGILQQIATNTTSDTSAAQADILKQAGDTIRTQAQGLAQQLLSGFGINLVGLSGLNFVQAVKGLDFDRIEGGMTTAQKGQFEALIQALIDAQGAIEQNTGSLNDLNGALGAPQSFSSTAWQWFRMAAFSGAGQLLPQFGIPHMQAGGFIRKSGIFQLHAGEFVVNPQGSNMPNRGGDINVTVHEAGPQTDYTYLANRIAFAARTPST